MTRAVPFTSTELPVSMIEAVPLVRLMTPLVIIICESPLWRMIEVSLIDTLAMPGVRAYAAGGHLQSGRGRR